MNPPKLENVEPLQRESGKLVGQLRSAEVVTEDRNYLRFRKQDPENLTELFLAIRIALPHGMKGVKAFVVETNEGPNLNRIFCDYATTANLADGRSVLYIWSFLHLKNGEFARFLHVPPGQANLVEVSLRYRKTSLSIRHSVHTTNAVPFPSRSLANQPIGTFLSFDDCEG